MALIAHPKMKIMSSFTHPHVFSVEHKRWIFEKKNLPALFLIIKK